MKIGINVVYLHDVIKFRVYRLLIIENKILKYKRLCQH